MHRHAQALSLQQRSSWPISHVDDVGGPRPDRQRVLVYQLTNSPDITYLIHRDVLWADVMVRRTCSGGPAPLRVDAHAQPQAHASCEHAVDGTTPSPPPLPTHPTNLQKLQRPYCPPVYVNSEDPLFLLYTSGSTGKPKGVVHASVGRRRRFLAAERALTSR